MFTRSCPRMGVRFASGNVHYMNRTFTARHLQCVASPLYSGFITPMRFASTSSLFAAPSGIVAFGGNSLVASSLLEEPIGTSRSARRDIMQILTGFDMVPTNVFMYRFVCASVEDTDHH